MKKKKDGAVVNEIPAPSRPFRYNIDWDHLANMARNTGKPVLAGEKIRISQISALRQYTRPAFRDETGHIAVAMRNSTTEGGVRYGDVYFEWVSNNPIITKESK